MHDRIRAWASAKAQAQALLTKDSAHTDWMNECVPNLMDMGKDQIVAVAACLNMWREAWEEAHPDGADDPGPSPKEADEESPLAEEKQLQHARERLRAWNEADHPRVPAGGPDGGQFGEGGGGGAAPAAKPGKSKKPAKKEDFDKAGIAVRTIGDPSPKGQEAAIEKWNKHVGIEPEEFKKEFLGGLNGTMSVIVHEGTDNDITVIGDINGKGIKSRAGRSGEGLMIAHYERKFNVDDKHAYSALFRVEKEFRGTGIGKHMLAGNVAMYQKLGIDHVDVTAALDVGGHAWAKYGYVPDQGSWDSLRRKLEAQVTATGGGGGNRSSNTMEADEWGQLSDDVQTQVRNTWKNDSHGEFLQQEEQNWRESGGALNDAKSSLSDQFTNNQVGGNIPGWVTDAIDATRKRREDNGEPPIPYTNQQIYDSFELKYDSDGEGRNDPDIEFDDSMLKAPAGYDPAQGTLPGIEPLDPASFLTEEMRDQLKGDIEDGFNEQAESDADDINPPSYLAEQVDEYQDDYWESQDDEWKLGRAQYFDLDNIKIEPDEDEEAEQTEMVMEERVADPLLTALRDPNPKALWRVADHPRGKELLPGKSWSGRLDFKDKESMDRFNEYVGRVKYA